MKTYYNYLKFIFLILTAAFIFSSCNDLVCVKGNGKIIKQSRKITPFNALDISGSFSVVMRIDSTPSVAVEADENLQKHITTKVENGTLVIENEEAICGSKDLKIYISTAGIDNIAISGAVDVQCNDTIRSKEMNIEVSGVGGIKLALDVEKLDIGCSGSGNIRLKGKAENANAEISGTGTISAFDLLTWKFTLSNSGVGKADLNVSSDLDVSISGAATVNYKGDPKVKQDISGVGTLKKVD
jgi:hypothetical protein